MDWLLGRILCRLGRHDWVFVRRRPVLGGGKRFHRTDECARCGTKEVWMEVDGVKRELVSA